MARESMIDAYLAAFDRRVAHRRDRDDLVSEIADHLHCAVERGMREGLSRERSERDVLDRFGDPRVVAALVSAVPMRGGAMSLLIARRLPWLSAFAALLWLAVVGVCTYATVGPGLPQHDAVAYTVLSLLAGAFLLTTAALVAQLVRARGEVSDAAMATGLIGVVAAILTVPFVWYVLLWAGPLIGLVAATVVRTRQSGVSSRSMRLVALTALGLVTAALLGLWALSVTGVGFGEEWLWIMVGALAATIALIHLDVAIHTAVAAPRPAAPDRGALV